MLGIEWGDDEGDDTADQDEDDGASVWEENEPALRLFVACMTQWRMGPAGPVGLDYAVVPLMARQVAGIRRRELRGLWWQIQVMEDAALEWFSEQRND